MAESAPTAEAAPRAGASGGIGLLYNAAGSRIVSVDISPGSSQREALAPFVLFPASQPTGSSQADGCSFPIPQGGAFSVTINFQSGQQVQASVTTPSQAAPALFIVAFLNGIVVADPTGKATSISFSRGLTGIVAAI